ncbi:MAG: type II secretion system protein [Deltaproteobacteria bacterium]|nr:type II secretion system protein [Deltaproteobacteria bacterium]
MYWRRCSRVINVTDKGFTLVELVLVIAMLGVLGFVLGPGLGAALRGYDTVWSRRQVLSHGKEAMDRMAREIRLIESSADVVSVGSSSQFQFEYPNGTLIVYDRSGTNLRRNSDVLAQNVSALQFQYYDEAGNTTSTAANVRRVQIQLTLDAAGGHGSLTLRTSVFLRNTGNNYDGYALQ